MLNKWDGWYKGIKKVDSFRYGQTKSYELAEKFLAGLSVEDWGCGPGQFKNIHIGEYVGVDGSQTPVVNKLVDLREYKSQTEGLMMRHVLEHNYDWDKVLANAVDSFTKRFVLVLFTPFQEETKELAHNLKHGVDVPDLGFKREDITSHFQGLSWYLETIESRTHYKVEHIFYIEK